LNHCRLAEMALLNRARMVSKPMGRPGSSFMKVQEGLVRMESKKPKAALRAARIWGRVSYWGYVAGDGGRSDEGRAAASAQQKIRTVYFMFLSLGARIFWQITRKIPYICRPI